jgi:hypothetical protein
VPQHSTHITASPEPSEYRASGEELALTISGQAARCRAKVADSRRGSSRNRLFWLPLHWRRADGKPADWDRREPRTIGSSSPRPLRWRSKFSVPALRSTNVHRPVDEHLALVIGTGMAAYTARRAGGFCDGCLQRKFRELARASCVRSLRRSPECGAGISVRTSISQFGEAPSRAPSP